MSVRAQTAASARPRRPPPSAAPSQPRVLRPRERRSAGRALLAGGALWVLVLAAMLGGIVALNVGALRKSLALNQVTAQAQQLRTQNDVLAAEAAALARPSRVNAFARRIGMVPAEPAPSDYLQLRPLPQARPDRPARAGAWRLSHRHAPRHPTRPTRTR